MADGVDIIGNVTAVWSCHGSGQVEKWINKMPVKTERSMTLVISASFGLLDRQQRWFVLFMAPPDIEMAGYLSENGTMEVTYDFFGFAHYFIFCRSMFSYAVLDRALGHGSNKGFKYTRLGKIENKNG